jgi:hypothetical protein
MFCTRIPYFGKRPRIGDDVTAIRGVSSTRHGRNVGFSPAALSCILQPAGIDGVLFQRSFRSMTAARRLGEVRRILLSIRCRLRICTSKDRISRSENLTHAEGKVSGRAAILLFAKALMVGSSAMLRRLFSAENHRTVRRGTYSWTAPPLEKSQFKNDDRPLQIARMDELFIADVPILSVLYGVWTCHTMGEGVAKKNPQFRYHVGALGGRIAYSIFIRYRHRDRPASRSYSQGCMPHATATLVQEPFFSLCRIRSILCVHRLSSSTRGA